jgi:glycosyltransferase involved in cell wall biosynthesis
LSLPSIASGTVFFSKKIILTSLATEISIFRVSHFIKKSRILPMSNIRFSIVIPTYKNHAKTLKFTLKTCLAQDFESFEIIVCHDTSSPIIKKMVDGYSSQKIKFVGSDKRLAMSDNWELAVSKAVGEYVILIGDDDGLLLHALSDIDHLIKMLDIKALRWERVYYSWPDNIDPNSANILHIPLIRGNRFFRANIVISRVANLRMDYTKLPMLYNSAIHQDLISVLRKKTGRVFKGSQCDIYSGFAFAYLARRYASVGRPMSINAGSGFSDGALQFGLRPPPFETEFYKLSKEAGLIQHPKIPLLQTLADCIADSFLHLKENLFPGKNGLRLNRKRLVINCINELKNADNMDWERDFQEILNSLSDNVKLQKWFDSNFSAVRPPQGSQPRTIVKLGADGTNLHLDASEFGVRDVFGAAELCERLLNFKKYPIEWPSWRCDLIQKLEVAARIFLR